MQARYFGKKTVRNEFGDVIARYNPEVEVTFTEEEKDLAIKRLDSTGFAYDSFACDDIYDIRIPVQDREEADEFGKVVRLEYIPRTDAPFNLHIFVDSTTGEYVIEGYSTEH